MMMIDPETHQSFHVFHGTHVSLSQTATPIVHTFNLNNNIRVQFTQPNTLKARITTGPLSPETITLEEFLTEKNFISFFQIYFPYFFRNIIYRHDNNNTIYLMHVKNYLDMYFVPTPDSLIYKNFWFRPTNFTSNLNNTCKNWQANIIHLIRMLIERHKTDTITTMQSSSLPPPPITDRNVKTCTIKRFLKRPPPHLQCKQHFRKNSPRQCKHLSQLNLRLDEPLDLVQFGKKNDYDNVFICNNVLQYLIDQSSENDINQLYNFSCQLCDGAIIATCTKIFGRFEGLHSILCCPKKLINKYYFYSLCTLFRIEDMKFLDNLM
nr:hypothetical protein [Microctonus hyperodae filamentous virus]